MTEIAKCGLCGEPMPEGEEMFNYHGYSGPCPKPPLPPTPLEASVRAIRKWQRHHLLRQFGENGLVLPENMELSQHIDRLISAVIDEQSYADLRASGGIADAP
jgi:hypothetical protein